MRVMRRVAPIALALFCLAVVTVGVALITSGCGSKKGNSAADGYDSASPGAKVFADAGCGGCHTMATAGATGKVGPNLDELRPNKERVELQECPRSPAS